MGTLWLTSAAVQADGAVVLGADRIALDEAPALAAFRGKLHRLHPWLLPFIKADSLASEDDDGDACGGGTAAFHLDGAEPIALGGEAMPLSHCGQSFFDRLPSPAATLERLRPALEAQAVNGADRFDSPYERELLTAMERWLSGEAAVILIKED